VLVICCGMPRAASTLQFQIVCELIERAGRGVRPVSIPTPMSPEMALGPDPIHVARMHGPDPALERKLNPRFTRYLYIYRDVRDAIASYILKEGDIPPEQIGRIVEAHLLGPYHHFVSRHNVLISRYETVVRSIPAEIRRISRFIGVEADHARAEAISYKVDLRTQQKHIAERGWREDETHDAHTFIHPKQIHDGKVGKFRGVLTPPQLEEVERVARGWLTTRGYTLASGEDR
jgi:hypothetical protein